MRFNRFSMVTIGIILSFYFQYGRDEDFNTEQLAEQGRLSFRRNIKAK